MNKKIQTSESLSALLEGSDTGNLNEPESIQPAPSSITNVTDSASKPYFNITMLRLNNETPDRILAMFECSIPAK